MSVYSYRVGKNAHEHDQVHNRNYRNWEKKSETTISASNIEFPTVIDVIFSITYIVRVNAK